MGAVKWKNLLPFAQLAIINTAKRGENKSDFATVYSIPRSMLGAIKEQGRHKGQGGLEASSTRRVHAAAYGNVEMLFT